MTFPSPLYAAKLAVWYFGIARLVNRWPAGHCTGSSVGIGRVAPLCSPGGESWVRGDKLAKWDEVLAVGGGYGGIG